jgi:hypothetical protein
MRAGFRDLYRASVAPHLAEILQVYRGESPDQNFYERLGHIVCALLLCAVYLYLVLAFLAVSIGGWYFLWALVTDRWALTLTLGSYGLIGLLVLLADVSDRLRRWRARLGGQAGARVRTQ